VVRGYFDPHEWRSDVEALAEEFDTPGNERVIPWGTDRYVAMHAALDRLHTGLSTGEVWHDDDKLAAEHYGNAYVQMRGKARLVRKEYPNSPRKIDSVVGDALALEARADALAAGWGKTETYAAVSF
jgi:phage terminase large subunit-like protein